ncbi:hypothetical protein BV898_10702 [Hypsibius exemplaris]|uniref:Uncharacterized protein n=1 Tax=Hypsibius exemplaris TaxID=2072580 RepID=A0A1W0WIN2_HYPEX|nr:hypothetical protein BV898_10702 [Hypsibius exemplaris]
MTIFPQNSLALSLMGALCIMAATITQIVTLSWRNWIAMLIPWRNSTSKLEIGLWGACARSDHCYAFHAEGARLPWNLQVGIFLSMICICIEVLILAMSLGELLFMRNDRCPLKRLELYLAFLGTSLALTISAVMGLLALSGHEQDLWELLQSKMVLPGPAVLPEYSRFSVSQAWGFQALSCLYFICYMFVVKIQLSQAVIRVEISVANQEEDRPGRRNRICGTTPPPFYSPPPAYAFQQPSPTSQEGGQEQQQQETCLNLINELNADRSSSELAMSRTNHSDSSSLVLLL